MTVDGLLAGVGSEVVWQVVVTGFALVAVLAATVAVTQRRSVPAWQLVLGPAIAAAVVVVVGRVTLLGWADDPELTATRFAVTALVGPLTFGPVALTALGACAFAGAAWPPKRPLAVVATLVAGFAVAGIVVGGGVSAGFPIYASLRAVGYVVGTALIAVAVSGDQDDAAVAAGASLPLVVAVGEASERALAMLLVTLELDDVPPGRWAAAVDKMLGIVAPQWTASVVALGVASVWAAVGLLWLRRTRGAVGAVVLALAVAWAVLLFADIGAARVGSIRP